MNITIPEYDQNMFIVEFDNAKLSEFFKDRVRYFTKSVQGWHADSRSFYLTMNTHVSMPEYIKLRKDFTDIKFGDISVSLLDSNGNSYVTFTYVNCSVISLDTHLDFSEIIREYKHTYDINIRYDAISLDQKFYPN